MVQVTFDFDAEGPGELTSMQSTRPTHISSSKGGYYRSHCRD